MTLQTDSISRYTSNSPFHPLDVVIAWLEITLALRSQGDNIGMRVFF